MLRALGGAGEMELKPEEVGAGAMGLGWASCGLPALIRGGKLWTEDAVVLVCTGVADWKSSNSSSSVVAVVLVWRELKPLSVGALNEAPNSLGGVSGGMSSKRSISGSFGLTGSCFFGRAADVVEIPGFRLAGVDVALSSASSYSSKRSRRL